MTELQRIIEGIEELRRPLIEGALRVYHDDEALDLMGRLAREVEAMWRVVAGDRTAIINTAGEIIRLDHAEQDLTAGRIAHIRAMCQSSIEFDAPKTCGNGLTDRAWLAQSVLNILDGNIDDQIQEELTK